MALLRGKGMGIEVVFGDRSFDEALLELEERLSERPDFYRGTAATAVFGARLPEHEQLDVLRALLERFGIDLACVKRGACDLQSKTSALKAGWSQHAPSPGRSVPESGRLSSSATM